MSKKKQLLFDFRGQFYLSQLGVNSENLRMGKIVIWLIAVTRNTQNGAHNRNKSHDWNAQIGKTMQEG